MIENIIEKVSNKNFTFRKFISLSKEEKDLIIKRYKKDFPFQSKLFFYEFIKDWIPFNLNCPECNKELSMAQTFRQYKSKQIQFCCNRCAQKQEITLSKISERCLEKHGVLYTQQIKGSREKFKTTCLERFGGGPLANKEKLEKARNTSRIRYGYDHWAKDPDNVLDRNNTRKKNSNINYKVLDNLSQYLNQNICSFKEFEKLLELCNCSQVLLYRKLLKQNLISEGKLFRSRGEQDIQDFILQVYPNYKMLLNDKSIGVDLDIYIPEKNLAIEFNGDYWHSSSRQKKYINHHLNKTNLCEQKGIRLIHIWESEWINNQEFVKNLLNFYLGDFPQSKFKSILEPFNNRLPRDYFSVLDFPDSRIEEPSLEKSGNFDVYKTGYILI